MSTCKVTNLNNCLIQWGAVAPTQWINFPISFSTVVARIFNGLVIVNIGSGGVGSKTLTGFQHVVDVRNTWLDTYIAFGI